MLIIYSLTYWFYDLQYEDFASVDKVRFNLSVNNIRIDVKFGLNFNWAWALIYWMKNRVGWLVGAFNWDLEKLTFTSFDFQVFKIWHFACIC